MRTLPTLTGKLPYRGNVRPRALGDDVSDYYNSPAYLLQSGTTPGADSGAGVATVAPSSDAGPYGGWTTAGSSIYPTTAATAPVASVTAPAGSSALTNGLTSLFNSLLGKATGPAVPATPAPGMSPTTMLLLGGAAILAVVMLTRKG